jgi:hypothetical protein
MNFVSRKSLLLLCLATTIGCQSADEPAAATVAAPEPAAPVAAAPAEAKSAKAPTPVLENPKGATVKIAEFNPPFPERELFEPPKGAQSAVRRDEEHGQTVELKGFITVDEPKVVLSIDGTISPIPEGGEKYGVKVISIQPPKALLQRGRNRWTATLD